MIARINGKLSTRKIGDDVFIFDRKTSTIHSLNRVGTLIWELLADNADTSRITAEIESRFDVDISNAEADVLEFIYELKDKNLVEINNG
ncbi:unnamed protein product [marine sediment metagenome]|uniref:Coenzyme PQQ synthesis protein D (PqqD) n=1 Tax=marine sediment metagenome TaxID=412755 RepID=X0VGF6_9ZZZZ